MAIRAPDGANNNAERRPLKQLQRLLFTSVRESDATGALPSEVIGQDHFRSAIKANNFRKLTLQLSQVLQ